MKTSLVGIVVVLLCGCGNNAERSSSNGQQSIVAENEPTTHTCGTPEPAECGQRSVATCESDGLCSLVDAECPPNAYCLSYKECASTVIVADECDTRDVTSCEADGQCALIEAVCPPNADCAFFQKCVQSDVVGDECDKRDVTTCEADGQCALIEAVCPPNAGCAFFQKCVR